MKKTAVVILNWNGRALLEEFLPSVVKYTSHPDVEIIVADNGSTDTSMEFVASQFPEVTSILLPENYGFAGGYNIALKEVNAEYFVILNSDVEVTENWLTPILNLFDENPNTAIIQPKILDYKNKAYFEYAGAGGGFIDKFGYPFCRGRIFDTIEKDNHTVAKWEEDIRDQFQFLSYAPIIFVSAATKQRLNKLPEMIKKISGAITLRDVLIIIGLSLIGVGLYLFLPWVSFTVCGALILVGGFFMQEKK